MASGTVDGVDTNSHRAVRGLMLALVYFVGANLDASKGAPCDSVSARGRVDGVRGRVDGVGPNSRRGGPTRSSRGCEILFRTEFKIAILSAWGWSGPVLVPMDGAPLKPLRTRRGTCAPAELALVFFRISRMTGGSQMQTPLQQPMETIGMEIGARSFCACWQLFQLLGRVCSSSCLQAIFIARNLESLTETEMWRLKRQRCPASQSSNASVIKLL